MKVKDLIKELQKFPLDSEVSVKYIGTYDVDYEIDQFSHVEPRFDSISGYLYPLLITDGVVRLEEEES